MTFQESFPMWTEENNYTLKNAEGAIKKWTIQRNWQHRREQTKQKHNTICVGHHYTQANTHNANKTWTLLQTTRGKDEPSTVLMWKS